MSEGFFTRESPKAKRASAIESLAQIRALELVDELTNTLNLKHVDGIVDHVRTELPDLTAEEESVVRATVRTFAGNLEAERNK